MTIRQVARKSRWLYACLAAILTGAGAARLRAQGAQVAPQSAGEAATLFVSILTREDSLASSQELPQLLAGQRQLSVVDPDLLDSLLEKFHRAVRLAEWKASVELESSGDKATVQVEPAPPSERLKPVACVLENNAWRVDLLKTAQTWFGDDDALVKQLRDELSDEGRIVLRNCQSNLRQLALALKQYQQDYDEKFPPADRWCDVLQSYVRNEALFNCPGAEHGQFGYAMNWKLSRTPENKVAQLANTVLLYESSTLAWNHCGDGADLTFRHPQRGAGGGNYAYTDGHIKWRPREEPQNFRLQPFAPKPPPAPRAAPVSGPKSAAVDGGVGATLAPARILPSRGQFPRQLRQPRRVRRRRQAS